MDLAAGGWLMNMPEKNKRRLVRNQVCLGEGHVHAWFKRILRLERARPVTMADQIPLPGKTASEWRNGFPHCLEGRIGKKEEEGFSGIELINSGFVIDPQIRECSHGIVKLMIMIPREHVKRQIRKIS